MRIERQQKKNAFVQNVCGALSAVKWPMNFTQSCWLMLSWASRRHRLEKKAFECHAKVSLLLPSCVVLLTADWRTAIKVWKMAFFGRFANWTGLQLVSITANLHLTRRFVANCSASKLSHLSPKILSSVFCLCAIHFSFEVHIVRPRWSFIFIDSDDNAVWWQWDPGSVHSVAQLASVPFDNKR